jgi:beta-mannosidase
VRQSLDGDWRLRRVGPAAGAVPAAFVEPDASWPASVPGCVHTDLLAAGAIPDPYLDRNEAELGWIGLQAWEYSRIVTSSPAPRGYRTDLVFEGLDTIADVSVNGRLVARTRNMHRSYRFDVSDALRASHADVRGVEPVAHDIRVRFDSAEEYALRRREALGALPSIGGEPFAYLRKMACNFGWDWGPKLVTAGIWRSAALETWSTARLALVRPLVEVTDGVGHVRVCCDLERIEASAEVRVVAEVDGVLATAAVPPGAVGATVDLAVADPQLWWPRGLGQPTRYDLHVRLLEGDRLLDSWHRRIGFRTVTLDTSTDDVGSAFTIVVNDSPIFARGVNWIPDDCFPSRVDDARYRDRLEQAADAGVDLLRVWGGGIYESDAFYEVCDELGLLIWQDFPFACAAYPEDAELLDEVALEAAENVARLCSHPSLVLWNGSNENVWGKKVWKGFAENIGDRDWGLGYYLRLLPDVVQAVDPTRPYWPSSPYSLPPEPDPNAPDHGCMHIWDVWNDRDYSAYAEYVPRFVSEFGYAAAPAWSTLARAVHDAPIEPSSPGVRLHFKAIDGERKMHDRLAERFTPPADVDDWHFLTQLNQAHALRFAIEHFRSHRGVCMGTIWWQLNDCWPVTSWALVDGDGVPKPAWYALRDCYADQLLTLQPRAGHTVLFAVNETGAPWQCEATVGRYRFDGELLAEQSVVLRCGVRARANVAIDPAVATAGDPRRELLRVQAGSISAPPSHTFFVPDRERAYPQAQFAVHVDNEAGEAVVTVVADSLLVDGCLFADRLSPAARVDAMLVTMLPGEQRQFRVKGLHACKAAELARPVLRFANDRTQGAPGR